MQKETSTEDTVTEDTVTIAKAEFEITTRQSQIYQLICTVNMANAQIARLENEIARLKQNQK